MFKGYTFIAIGYMLAAVPQIAFGKMLPHSPIKSEFTTQHQIYTHNNTTNKLQNERDIHFYNDLCDVIELDLMDQKNPNDACNADLNQEELACVEHFRERPVIIRAVEEYKTRHGDEVQVKTRDSWELTFDQLRNDYLLSLKTFRDLVSEYFMPQKRFENFLDKYIYKPCNKARLYIYRKVIAPFAKTTFVIQTNIDPTYSKINCSDIIIDLDALASSNSIDINVAFENPLHMKIYIKQIA